MVLLIALSLSAVTLIVLLIVWRSIYLQETPPGPWGLPLIGHLHLLWGLPPHRALMAISKRYGPIVSLKLGMVPAVVISSHELARELFAKYDKHFSSRPYMIIGDSRFGFQGMASAPYGQRWKTMKRLYTEKLFTAKCLDSSSRVRSGELSNVLEAVLQFCSKGKPIDLRLTLTTLTFNAMSQTLTSKTYTRADDKEAVEFKQVIKEVISLVLKPCVSNFVPWYLRWLDWQIPRYKQVLAKQDKFLQKVVDEHKASMSTRNRKDFVDLMLDYFGHGTQGEMHTKASLVETLIGGTDTTSVSSEWLMAAVIRDQRVLKKIQNELDTVVGKTRMVREADFPKLEYLQAVIKETFRLYPSAPLLMPRVSNQAQRFGNYDIPKGTVLLVNSWAVGTDPEVWERPTEFMPERFLGSCIDIKGQNYEVIPFGSGRRKCPGLALGLRTLELVVANLIHAFDWRFVPGVAPSMEEEFTSGCQLKVPLLAIATPRLSNEVFATLKQEGLS